MLNKKISQIDWNKEKENQKMSFTMYNKTMVIGCPKTDTTGKLAIWKVCPSDGLCVCLCVCVCL